MTNTHQTTASTAENRTSDKEASVKHKEKEYMERMMIDYIFHLPLEIAGVVLAYCFFSLFRSWRSGKLAAVEANKKDSLAGAPAR